MPGTLGRLSRQGSRIAATPRTIADAKGQEPEYVPEIWKTGKGGHRTEGRDLRALQVALDELGTATATTATLYRQRSRASTTACPEKQAKAGNRLPRRRLLHE